MTDNRTTELRISEPLRGFIRHQTNRAYIDSGQTRWLTKIADEIDERHEQAIVAMLGSKRESELKDALNDVAEKWAITQVQAEDNARRCILLEMLVRDWQELYENPDYGECVRLTDRTRKLGIEVER